MAKSLTFRYAVSDTGWRTATLGIAKKIAKERCEERRSPGDAVDIEDMLTHETVGAYFWNGDNAVWKGYRHA